MAGHIATAGNVTWTTPPWVVDAVRTTFGGPIGVDPCWNKYACTEPLAAFDLNDGVDGLEMPWYDPNLPGVYCNPPFGKCRYHVPTGRVLTPAEFKIYSGSDRDEFKKSSIKDWIQKCSRSATQGAEVIFLGPAAVDTAGWQEYIFPTAQALCLPRGRLKFGEPGALLSNTVEGGPAPMACAIVYWGPNQDRFHRAFKAFGPVVDIGIALGRKAA